jgi:predicted house-cleaning NTP pyrophosphatase (Maf/HAM1 superfamily)
MPLFQTALPSDPLTFCLLTGKIKMKPTNIEKEARKAAMRDIRAQRKKFITAASVIMKTQKKEINTITEFLKDQAGTIPEIANAIHMPSDKTLWYMATLKKYGQIVEVEKQGAFFKYALNKPKNPQEKAEV